MAKKISIIIPNFNGEKLLSKNLPKVTKNYKNCEIILVDDASTDKSVELVKKEFKNVKLIKFQKNQGFAKAINAGAIQSTGEILFLLNSDVEINANFSEKIQKKFSDKNLFAIALKDISHEGEKKIAKGKGGARFKQGFFSHFALNSNLSGETLWVSGGSGFFSKQKFLKLGGFDSVYSPFYWEDIDLCYRAWKYGYKCIFDASLKVNHFHDKGAIKQSKKDFYIKAVSYKNQFIFVWKNISDYFFLLQHLAWMPYNFLKSFLRLDLPFFLGFFWAISKIPKLLLDENNRGENYQFPDRFVLQKFNKK